MKKKIEILATVGPTSLNKDILNNGLLDIIILTMIILYKNEEK